MLKKSPREFQAITQEMISNNPLYSHLVTCNTTPASLSLHDDHVLHLMTVLKCTEGHAARTALYCEWWHKGKPGGQRCD